MSLKAELTCIVVYQSNLYEPTNNAIDNFSREFMLFYSIMYIVDYVTWNKREWTMTYVSNETSTYLRCNFGDHDWYAHGHKPEVMDETFFM